MSKLLVCLSCLMLLFTSCKTAKESQYFKTMTKDTTITGFVNNDFEAKIKAGDNLSIVITSLSKDEDILFNQAAGEIVSGNSTATTGIGFLVATDGTVALHRLGSVKAEGKTRKEFALYLQNAMLPYMKDPIANVYFLNHRVTVMGAVKSPQVLSLPGEPLSLLDAIVLSGDMIEASRKDDVMIIRETGNEKTVKHINLEDHSLFKSPWYYVQPNDIVYVKPDIEKMEREEKRRRVQTTVTLIASGVSLILIIADRIFR
ncbi:polysaccharide biosynthesis/export family protein [Ferruginibacter sp. HRS2-29]|uniref:polysaccharide biosynthesis/export family protein n=1 Tax=Ferruginibacter sp. HRS2-29 TaxID=2487334 RepID=UPI0020CC4A61|nr:polysaccharide biosynthesis/export family protein [Ferruginibacter sp. HRS2-29]